MSETHRAAHAPRQERYGPEDLLTRLSPGGVYALKIETPFAKPGWQARQMRSGTRPEFPGSAVLFEGEIYEVLRIEEMGGSGAGGGRRAGGPRAPSSRAAAFEYLLGRWDQRLTIRQMYTYSEEVCAEQIAARREVSRLERQLWSVYLSVPLLGLLPGRVQRRLERTHNLNPVTASLASAAVFLGLGAVATGFGLLQLVWRDPHEPLLRMLPWREMLPFSRAVFMASCFRLAVVNITKEPLGSLLLEVAYRVWRALRPGARREREETAAAAAPPLVDHVYPLPEGRGVRILSALPKPHWSTSTGIHFGDGWYQLVERGTEVRRGQTWYSFVLEASAEAQAQPVTVEYAPEEVAALARGQVLERRETWVGTLSMLWGLLDAPTQERLAALYAYQPLRATAESLVAEGVAAFVAGGRAFTLLNQWQESEGSKGREGGPLDILILLVSAGLLVETFVRARRWRAGEVTGSVLGGLVRPFAARLLK